MYKRIIIAFLLLGTMACNKEMNDIQSETYQAEFKANFPAAFTKITGKDSWTGDGTEKIAFTLKQAEYSSTGIYTIKNASGTTEAETPAFWQNSKTAAQITAVFPASVAKNSLKISDQSTSDKFNQCDILKAVNNNASFGDNLVLDFSHAMAKVRVELTPGTAGIDLTKVSSVKIYSNTYAWWDSASASVTGGTPGRVNACMETKTASSAVYEAMVVPGEINPTEFITIVMDDSSTYKYTAPSSPKKTLLPGNIYTYNITVVSL